MTIPRGIDRGGWSGRPPEDVSRYAVVDVETSALLPASDRVLAVAVVAWEPAQGETDRLANAAQPCCDPGPVHVHALTAATLANAPRFADVARALCERLDGRVVVAHNAAFELAFLQAEAGRCEIALPTAAQLCTCTLARR